MAGEEAQGATIYVSLEPCSHYGLTPPCAKAIIDNGIQSVVYAVKDGSLKNSGHEMLYEAGIDVKHEPSKEQKTYMKHFSTTTNENTIYHFENFYESRW